MISSPVHHETVHHEDGDTLDKMGDDSPMISCSVHHDTVHHEDGDTLEKVGDDSPMVSCSVHHDTMHHEDGDTLEKRRQPLKRYQDDITIKTMMTMTNYPC